MNRPVIVTAHRIEGGARTADAPFVSAESTSAYRTQTRRQHVRNRCVIIDREVRVAQSFTHDDDRNQIAPAITRKAAYVVGCRRS